MALGKDSIAVVCEKLAQPIADQMNLSIWDVRYEKEGSGWFLRFFIDKEGGVTIDDCENFSRAVDPVLDKEDPIDQSYCLEVSSPGVERELKKPEHFERYLGQKVTLRLIRPENNIKELTGELISYNDGVTTIKTENGEFSANKKQIAFVRLFDDFN